MLVTRHQEKLALTLPLYRDLANFNESWKIIFDPSNKTNILIVITMLKIKGRFVLNFILIVSNTTYYSIAQTFPGFEC